MSEDPIVLDTKIERNGLSDESITDANANPSNQPLLLRDSF